MKYEKSCGAVVFDGNKVLIIQQVKGHWGFPKGHVEDGETEVQTAVREIKEETNLDVEIDETKRFVEHYSPEEGIEKDVVFFIAKKIGGEIKVQEEEVKDTKWLTPREAMDRLTYESSKNILRNIIEILNLQ
ncbi:MAG: NUDIX domain-containing protein [Clostridia bacterium]|nr:NUDIX domain-containing protein [Clostridia bacterium]MBR4260914.1 NUDIX domain-containing protein [Clostridia bacterium]